jgi:PKD repeat protein
MKNSGIYLCGVMIVFLSFHLAVKADTEPNDTYQQATTIYLNTDYTGNLSSTDTKDWYRVQVRKDGRLNINDATTAGLDYFVRLFEENGTTRIYEVLRYKNNTGERISISLTPGYYYIEFSRHASDATGSYAFTMQYTEASRTGDAEPNDNREVAQVVEINASLSGNLGHRKIGMYDQNDWYKFTVPADGRLQIQDTTTSNLDYWLYLYEEDGTTLIKQELRYKNNTGASIAVSLSPGTYYLLFKKFSSDYSTFGEYFFTLACTEASRPGDAEPNDNREDSQVVEINTSVSGNLGHRKKGMYDQNDWYKFTVPADGRLQIQDTTTSNLDYWLYLYEEDGTTLIKKELRYKNNTGTSIAVSLSPGTYYLLFQKYSSDYTTFGEYFFTLAFTQVSRPGDAEPNDSIEDAQVVEINTSVSGNLGHRKTGMYDQNDWYKFTITSDGRLHIQDTTTSNLDYWIYLYEEDGTTLIKQELRYKNNTGGSIAVNLSPGNYYLLFKKFSSDYSTFGEYFFTLRYTEVSRPGDAEPNDSLQFAVDISPDSLYTGNLGHRKKGIYDNRDWYKLSLPSDGLLMLHDTTSPKLDYWVFLYDETGTKLIRQILRYTNNAGSRISEFLTAGEYYLLFSKYSSDYFTYGEYSFYPEFLPRPQADFTFVRNISSVSFSNKTLHGQSYKWFFDDGTESTEVNPGHDFNEPGEYKVELIARNMAGSDTVSHYVTIEGLKKIVDSKGGNTGNVSVNFYGVDSQRQVR